MGQRAVYFAGVARETSIYRRALLPASATFRGPSIVEEDGSTTVIPPDWTAEVDDFGNIIMEAG